MTQDTKERDGVIGFMREAVQHLRSQCAFFGEGLPPDIAQAMADNAADAAAALEIATRSGTVDRLEALIQELAALRSAPAAPQHEPIAPDPFTGLAPEARKPWHEHLPKFFADTGLTQNTIDNYNVTYRRFRKQVGDKAVVEISAVDAVQFMDDLVKTGAARQGRTTVAADTQNKHASALKAFFGWAKGKLLCRENIAAGLRATKAAKKEAIKFERRAFTPDELKALFNHPLFSGCKSEAWINIPGATKVRDHRFWMPLLALYTGGRRGELTQVLLSDIKNIDGVDYIYIRIEVDPDEDSEEDIAAAKSIKTINAKRCIPIHPVLKRIGFMNFVRERRKAVGNSERLFEQFGYGQLYNQRVLVKARLKTAITSFHSLRHNYKNAIRAIVGNLELQNRLMGHAPVGAGGRYGDPLTPEEVEAFVTVCNWRVDLSHLYVE